MMEDEPDILKRIINQRQELGPLLQPTVEARELNVENQKITLKKEIWSNHVCQQSDVNDIF